MKPKKWGFADNKYELGVDQTTQQFGRIQHNVDAFITTEGGSNRDLYMFKNILSTKLQNSIEKISDLTIQQIATKYLPFVFNVQSLPDKVIIALAASQMKLNDTNFDGLAKMGANTISFEAKKCVQQSIMYGNGGIQAAIVMLTDKSGFFLTGVDAMITAYEKGKQTLANIAKKTFKGFTNLMKNSKRKQIEQIVDDTNKRLKPLVSKGSAQLLSSYIKSIRAYGSILIDFWYLNHYAMKTNAYGKTVMYIPTLNSLLFSLEGGVVKVYLKTQKAISLIDEKQFTQEFLQGLAKGMAARDNADIIKQYNYQVSTNSLKSNQRQQFKDNLDNNQFVTNGLVKKIVEVQKKI